MYSSKTRTALQGLGRLNRPVFAQPLRQFSVTPRYGVDVLFQPTENEDLNKIFQEIQDKIALPAQLPQKQRAIVFDPQKRTYLKQNPIVIEVEGTEHTFSTIDEHKDMPSVRPLLLSAVDKMTTPKDWQNLPTLLAAYHSAGLKVKNDFHGKIARLATERGFGTILIDCAQQADETGFYFRNVELVNQVLRDICNKVSAAAEAGDWETAQRFARKVDTVFDLVQRPKHVASIGYKTGHASERLQFSLTARGQALLARSAVVKVKSEAGQPVEGDLELLRDEIALFGSLWADKLDTPVGKIPEFARLSPGGSSRWGSMSPWTFLEVLMFNIKGIRAAHHVARQHPEVFKPVESQLDSVLLRVVKILDSHAADVVNTAKNKDKIVSEYTALIGHAPGQAP